jgi:hypothetical protein
MKTRITNHFEEKEIKHAPINLDNSEASAWASGYNTALELTKASELLKQRDELLEALQAIIHPSGYGFITTTSNKEKAITAINNATLTNQ